MTRLAWDVLFAVVAGAYVLVLAFGLCLAYLSLWSY
jgi:hypothetical protein